MKNLDLANLLMHCEKNTAVSKVTEEQATTIERETRLQCKSQEWFKWRAGRVTASSLHSVFATSLEKPSLTVVKQVCYPGNTFSTEALRWGIEHEATALNAYISSTTNHHQNLLINKCGFIINCRFPELGASPDGLIMCDCCGKGCLEIKCPFKYRSSSIKHALETHDKHFCLELSRDGLTLRKSHPYYAQVQAQIFVTCSNHCDFVVWTQKDMVVVRLFPDQAFWEPRLKKAQQFFKCVCLPELVARYFTVQ
ncbi:hypothetical protein WMY93_020505, partial [Mugilogobius chulae]